MLGATRRLRRGERKLRCGSSRKRPVLTSNAAAGTPARKRCIAATSPGRKVRQYKASTANFRASSDNADCLRNSFSAN